MAPRDIDPPIQSEPIREERKNMKERREIKIFVYISRQNIYSRCGNERTVFYSVIRYQEKQKIRIPYLYNAHWQ